MIRIEERRRIRKEKERGIELDLETPRSISCIHGPPLCFRRRHPRHLRMNLFFPQSPGRTHDRLRPSNRRPRARPDHPRRCSGVRRPGARPALTQLPLGAIKPAGWLKEQLEHPGRRPRRPPRRVLARHQGLAPGSAARPRAGSATPYWLDGVVPLAYLLDDPALKAKVKRYVDYILDHQTARRLARPRRRQRPEAQALRRLAAVRPVQGADPVPGGHRRPPRHPGDAQGVQEDRRGHRPRSRSIAGPASAAPTSSSASTGSTTGPATRACSTWPTRSHRQSYDWRSHFEHFDSYREKSTKFGLDNHGVNTGMGLKFGGRPLPPIGRPEGPRRHLPHARHARHVPRPGHRHLHLRRALAGRSPSQGTELCTVAEAMYSLELLAGITGDAAARRPPGEARLQRLPGDVQEGHERRTSTTSRPTRSSARSRTRTSTRATGPTRTSTAWSRTSAAARPTCTRAGPSSRRTSGRSRPTAGWRRWRYAPCVVETTVDGKPVKVEVETDYPFSDRVDDRGRRSPEQMTLPLRIRIPGWCETTGSSHGQGFDD